MDRQRYSNKYLFSTMIKCKECGWSFRRVERKYREVSVRWVCSGRNGKGADSCPNKTSVEEKELIAALEDYFAKLLKNKKNVVQYVIDAFEKIYKAKDENINYERELNKELEKLQSVRQKYMDMYTDDLISREELNEKLGGMRKKIAQLENGLKIAQYHIEKRDQLEIILNRTFRDVESIVNVADMTNAQLRKIVQKIEVDKDGNVDIYLRIMGELGLNNAVLIYDDYTQRCD